MKKNNALIDFAGPGPKVYQVTVQSDHTLCPKGLTELFLASGHIKDNNDTGELEIQLHEHLENLPKLQFYWVVPHGIEGNWNKKAPKKISEKNINGEQSNPKDEIQEGKGKDTKEQKQANPKILTTLLQNYVMQFVLIMDSSSNKLDELVNKLKKQTEKSKP